MSHSRQVRPRIMLCVRGSCLRRPGPGPFMHLRARSQAPLYVNRPGPRPETIVAASPSPPCRNHSPGSAADVAIGAAPAPLPVARATAVGQLQRLLHFCLIVHSFVHGPADQVLVNPLPPQFPAQFVPSRRAGGHPACHPGRANSSSLTRSARSRSASTAPITSFSKPDSFNRWRNSAAERGPPFQQAQALLPCPVLRGLGLALRRPAGARLLRAPHLPPYPRRPPELGPRPTGTGSRPRSRPSGRGFSSRKVRAFSRPCPSFTLP